MPKLHALESLMTWLPFCTLTSFSLETYSNTLKLIEKYEFQLFDGIIVTYALASNCDVLYSEDMAHNLLVENQLKIINPKILKSKKSLAFEKSW